MRWRSDAAALAWLLAVLAMSAHAIWWWHRGAPLDTSVLAMLPRDTGTLWEERARDLALKRGERHLLLLVGNTDWQIATSAADAAEAALRNAPLACRVPASLQSVSEFFASHRNSLLDAATRAELHEATASELARIALARLYAPLPQATGLGASRDPFGFYANWLQTQASRMRLQPRAGRLVADDGARTWVALSCELEGSPFEREVQQRVAVAISAARKAAATTDTELIAAGVVLHAQAAADAAQSDISTIGTSSLIGIALLALAVFGSLRPVLVLQLPMLVGALAGFSACLLVFGRMHALTMVFGASLLGVVIDYPIHYACHVQSGSTVIARLKTLRTLLPGLTIALLTTVAAYLALAIPPFPGLRQMALFASAGLVGAWLTVVLWCPWLVTQGVRRHAAAVRALVWIQRRTASCPLRTRILGLVLLATAAIPGVTELRVNDDLRMLNNSPPALLAEQSRVAGIAGLASPAQYFLVKGPDAATVLQREEALAEALDRVIAEGHLGGYLALSQWVPSPAQQARDQSLMQERVFSAGGALELFAQEAGFDASWLDEQRNRFRAARATPLSLDAWLAQPAAAAQRAQWLGCADGECASVVLVHGIAGAEGLRALAALAAPESDIAWIDTVAKTSALLARYRAGMTDMLGLAVAACFVLLWQHYRAATLRAIAPPLLAGYLTLALFGWTGVEVNLFVVLAFVLVLGMGVDYGIYLAEPLDQDLSGVGVALDVLTTILGFGLLALSSTPALQVFGLTLAVAISLCWLIAGLSGLQTAAEPSSQHMMSTKGDLD